MKVTLKTAAIAALAAATLVLTTPLAARNSGEGRDIGQRLKKMKQHLNLTDDQAVKIRTILESAKAEAMRNKDTYNDKEARRNAKTELRRETMEKIKAVLTPEQQEKLGKRLEKRKK